MDNTTTITTIEVVRHEKLANYTHATLTDEHLDDIVEGIEEIRGLGFSVLWAQGERASVPNSYWFAIGMRAPFWSFDGQCIVATNGRLDTRPKGRPIRATFAVAGQVVPEGFRCISRDESSVIVRRK